MDLNRATILGRLTRDPELRSTTSGKTVATLSVATNRVWNDQSGQKQEQSEFHNCVLWGKLADIAGQYLSKGRRVYVEGRIQTRDWVGTDGVKKYRTELVADNLIMLDGPRGTGSAPAGSNDDSMPPVDDSSGDDEIKVEDIPF
ncbi:MAG: single-stranded DNA-binding protein [Candidatus Magasanikbacteria bacterium CG_4_9_14_0_2_um_filter_42_11]|uniref:Single-stranded DNA-binding protein n=1 Tax=Candidatus Magasanikbacteria bacterium CG_4_9_14_0_2_um_filter_42_11 TaxID=1974643 RepID=A0A2M8FB37_9BACT|nr:MAG: single-stranded DNA-binding protein [Candidatus Magasanikbacteria bacterium CG10_big_fil_rev_8_21_14_0_10_43_9]PIY92611.1 MAG: single-stranded DNA-binding protein [Candidatus Magasanikbacteria bacterium CG_4_10_14_0_8_um_filter_42_12]PJC52940.1 MAG: single-stranded DNA-binding protein [Candidatus Magasanikbacteria bacterium CG_4_9_14_0_2_um_filter_42_11]